VKINAAFTHKSSFGSRGGGGGVGRIGECSCEVMSIRRVMSLFHFSCKYRGNLR